MVRLFTASLFLALLSWNVTTGAEPRTLEQMLGYHLGEQLTDEYRLASVLEEIARSSPRARLAEYGRTFEGRPLWRLLLASESNIARLDPIREGLLKLTDPRAISPAQAEALLDELPVVAWMAYSVHGNEHSGTEAAISLAYRLAFSQEPGILSILQNSIVIIDPCQNPDGRARFIQNFRSMLGAAPNPDPLALEHDPAWASPRYNHYFFDLNRDWFILSQPETLARAKAFLQWPGQVFGDFHEMDASSTYFFYPPTEPVHSAFDQATRELWNGFGKALASEFDKAGLPYYTSEFFDAFYPGYGDTWPSLQGAIGMTYEQSSVRGLLVRRNDDTLYSYQDAIEGHVLASIATLHFAAEHRKELLRHFEAFYREAMNAEIPTLPQNLFIPSQTDPLKLQWLVKTLQAQGIELERLKEPLTLHSSTTWLEPLPKERTLAAGTLRIQTRQPRRRLLQALFEREAKLPESFVQEERQKLLRGETSGFYDITAWSLPLATGLEFIETNDAVSANTEPLVLPTPTAEAVLPANAVAYLVPWTGRMPHILFQLLNREIALRFATKEFKIEDHDYSAGTLLILSQRNKDLAAKLAALPEEARAELIPIGTGRSQSGPDLGSDSFYRLRHPRIALLGDRPSDETSFGALAYLFDIRYRIPFASLRPENLAWADLSLYNVIIVPDGQSDAWTAALKPAKEALDTWIRGGGTLIALRGGAAALLDEDLALSAAKLLPGESSPDSGPTKTEGGESKEKPTPTPTEKEGEIPPPGQKSRPRWPIETPGALLWTELNPHHFVAFGLPTRVPALLLGSQAFAPDPDRQDPVRFAGKSEGLRASGHLWPEAADKIKGTPYVIETQLGKGRVVLFLEDPGFRTLLWPQEKMLLNLILWGPSL